MILSSLLSLIGVAICLSGFITESNSQFAGDVRLVNSSLESEGRVEVYHNGTWGTICDSSWDIRDGHVICRQLGYPGAKSTYSYAYFGSGTGKVWLNYVYCSGTEKNLTSCSHSTWGRHSYYCNHRHDAGVACRNKTAPGSDIGGSCTFETGSNLCGYTNAKDNVVKWTLRQASSYYYYPYGSNPHVDHTFGNGYYISMQTYSYYHRSNNMARLISPQITGGKCVKFYHHMKGSNLAQLNVFVNSSNKETLIWQQVGGQYSYYTWMMVMVPVEGVTTFKIIFEGGIAGSSRYYGDVALDDIQILNVTCKLENSGNCNFDTGNLCGYTNAKDDDFDWSLHTGRTVNYYATGPQQDHTTGKGNYIYIRTSSRNGVAGQIARLISPEIYDTQCVEFYYHMKGSTIGDLNVFIDDGVSKKMVWQLVGEQSSNWSKAALPVKGLKAFRIIFEGVSGADYRGNIAIDDITVHPDTCALFPAAASLTLLDIRNITHNVRLVGNVSSAGRLEVLYKGRWGTVCGSNFPLTSARVVCKELGYKDAEMVVPCCSIFPSGRGRIMLENVQCRGDEPSISMCSHRGWGIARCAHQQDVGIICHTKNNLHKMRLNGSSHDYEGRVEVEVGGIWGTISDNGWDIWDADVFCRQIGFAGARGVSNSARYGSGSGPVWILGTDCTGHESAIWNCNVTLNTSPRMHDWRHWKDAGAECYDLRLTGGRDVNQGIVEIMYFGVWGTICNVGWDMDDAKVVCRQLGYSRAVSLKLGYSAIPSNNTEPLTTDLKCTGNEPSIGLCSQQVLFSIMHRCDHTKDAQVVCGDPIRPTPVKPEKGVVEIRFLTLSKKDWQPNMFKKSFVAQLNAYCQNHTCAIQSKFKSSDIIIIPNYPKTSKKHLVIQFKVSYPGSNRLFPKQIIYNMAREQKNIAGYPIVLPTPSASPQSKENQSTGLNWKMKIVVITLVVVVFVAAVLIIVFIYRKRKVARASSVRYRVQNMIPDDNNDDVHDDSLLALDHDDQAPLLTSVANA